MTIDMTGLNASLLHDAIEKMKGHHVSQNLCCRSIRPIGHYPAVVAPAHTIRLSRAIALDGGERTRVMAAYDAAPADTIVMVEVVGDLGGGVVGDVIAHRFKKLGVKATVVDGCIRDILGIEQYGVPVWSREVSMAGMVPSEVRVEVGCEVSIGGVLVKPGDIVAADMDGVFVCPAEFSGEAIALAKEFLASELTTHKNVASGRTIVEAYPSKTKPKA